MRLSSGVRHGLLCFGMLFLLGSSPALSCNKGGGKKGDKKEQKAVSDAVSALGQGKDSEDGEKKTAKAAEEIMQLPFARRLRAVDAVARKVHDPRRVKPLAKQLAKAEDPDGRLLARDLMYRTRLWARLDRGRPHGAPAVEGGLGPEVHRVGG